MNIRSREDFIEAIYMSAIAEGGDEDFNRLVNELDELLPDDKKVLRYQLLDAFIRFAIEKANALDMLKS